MSKKIIFSVLIAVMIGISFSSCNNCKLDPDLIVDLSGPTADIIAGETVDWEYVIESTKEGAENCKILDATASIADIIIDFFVDETDPQSDILLNLKNAIDKLCPGDDQTVVNPINVFNQEGIYLVSNHADIENTVTERDESNNERSLEEDLKSLEEDEFLKNASSSFRKKLCSSAAIVVVGKHKSLGTLNSYRGVPVYHAK